MSFYSDMASTADSLINQFGYSVTIKTPTNTGTVYNPTVTWASATATGLKLSYEKSEIDGNLVQAGDVGFLLKGAAVLDTKCRIVDGTAEYQIITVIPVAPGGAVVIQKIQARR